MSKNVIVPILAFLAGAGASFLVTKSLLEKKYAAIAEDEIASVKEAFERAKQRNQEAVKVKKNEKTKTAKAEVKGQPKTDEKINPDKILTRTSLDDDPYEQAKRDYHKISHAGRTKPEVTEKKDEEAAEDPDPDDEESEEDEDDCVRDDAGMSEEDMRNLTRVDRASPYIITDEEYADEFPHHDKVSLYYYRVDDVLTEENEEIIDDIDRIIGYQALSVLDTQTNVWVRNEPLGIDYEIMALNTSFAEQVHGENLEKAKNSNRVMTPRERYEERQKRRKTNNDE